MRDAHGRHTVDAEGYREVVLAVKEAAHDTMELQVNSEATRIYKALQMLPFCRPCELKRIDRLVALARSMELLREFCNWCCTVKLPGKRSPLALVPFVVRIREQRAWLLCAFGATEHPCMAPAAALGCH